MKPYPKDASLSTMLIGNSLALGLPIIGYFNGQLQPNSLWTYMSLGLQIVPIFNILRLFMRATLNVRSKPFMLFSAWFLSLACLASAYWWSTHFAGLTLN